MHTVLTGIFDSSLYFCVYVTYDNMHVYTQDTLLTKLNTTLTLHMLYVRTYPILF